MDLVREKGLFSFYEDGHGECCRIRKVNACAALIVVCLLCVLGGQIALLWHAAISDCCRIRKVTPAALCARHCLAPIARACLAAPLSLQPLPHPQSEAWAALCSPLFSAFCACRANCAAAAVLSGDCLQHRRSQRRLLVPPLPALLAHWLPCCPLPGTRLLTCTQHPSCPLHRCARCASSWPAPVQFTCNQSSCQPALALKLPPCTGAPAAQAADGPARLDHRPAQGPAPGHRLGGPGGAGAAAAVVWEGGGEGEGFVSGCCWRPHAAPVVQVRLLGGAVAGGPFRWPCLPAALAAGPPRWNPPSPGC